MKKTIILLFVLGVSVSQAEKLEITADKFIAKDAEKMVRFLGNAQIIQGKTRVRASRVVVYFNENNSTQKYSALGRVRFHIRKLATDYQGSCNEMHYLPQKKIYILKGNVKVKDQKNKRTITATEVKMNSTTGAFTIEGSKKSAAKLTFEMK